LPKRRAANLDHAARHVLRSKKAPPLLEKIKAAVTAARATSLPPALWPKPRTTRWRFGRNSHAFLEYPELELSTTWPKTPCARWRSVAKTGSTSAASKPEPKVAAILSVVETCRRMNIPVRE